jgi:hypothetical protein
MSTMKLNVVSHLELVLRHQSYSCHTCTADIVRYGSSVVPHRALLVVQAAVSYKHLLSECCALRRTLAKFASHLSESLSP